MWWPFVATIVIFAMGVEAFAPAPLRFWAPPFRNFVVTPKGVPNMASVPDRALPARLAISARSSRKSPDQVPYFKVTSDSTIVWDGTDLCIEASDNGDDAVQINRCTGGPAQTWNLMPLDAEQKTHQIQLKGTNRCINVPVTIGIDGLNEAAMQLQECKGKVTENWRFKEVIPPPTQSPSQRSFAFLMGHAMMPLLSMALLGTTVLSAWLRRRQKRTRLVVAGPRGMPANMVQGGLCLTTPAARRFNNVPLTVAFDATAREVVPAVMAIGAPTSQAPEENASLVAPLLEEEFKELVDSHEVVLFELEGCPFCEKTEKALLARGIAFEKKNIGKYQTVLKKLTSKTSAPSVWVNGTYVGGCNDGTEPWHGVLPMLANGRFDGMLNGEPAPSQASEQDLRSLVDSNDVVFFEEEDCQLCKTAEEALTDRGIHFKKVPIEYYRPVLEKMTENTGSPSVWVKGTYVGGCFDGTESWHGVVPMLAQWRFEAMLNGPPSEMAKSKLIEELDARGIKWRGSCFDKNDLVAVLEQAREAPPPPVNNNKVVVEDPSSAEAEVTPSATSGDDEVNQSSEARYSSAYNIAYTDAMKMKGKELKTSIAERGGRWADLFEKQELAARLADLVARSSMFSASGALSPGKVGHVTGDQLAMEIANPELPLVIDVFATWCGPCKMIAPLLDELARKAGEKLRVAKLDSDAEPEMQRKLSVDAFPTLIFMKDGKEVYRLRGVPEKPGMLEEIVDKYFQVQV